MCSLLEGMDGRLTHATYDVLQELGIDADSLTWRDLAICNGWETNMFYDHYESDEQVAKLVDDACLSCPVMAQCLQTGLDDGEWGVWGGLYLTSGKVDKNRNSHKTFDIWQGIRDKVGEHFAS